MNGKLPYSRETFVGAETEKDFRGMLWDMFAHDAHCTQERKEACNKRFESVESDVGKLEKRKWWDKGLAMVTAAVVALATVFGLSLRNGG